MKNKITLLLCLILFQITGMYGQERVVSGQVTSAENNLALPGVTVMVQGTNQGTVTDFDGNYSIEVDEDAVLVFSSVGFETREIAVNGQAVINVSMGEDLESLDEVVVTALNISRDKKSLGYSTQEVEGEDINITNNQNVIGALSGRVAGVQVTGSSGASMGGTQKIKIRGVNSITGGGEPLIVVDGTPISNSNFAGSAGADYGNLGQDINPSDIDHKCFKRPNSFSFVWNKRAIRGDYDHHQKRKKGNEGYSGGIEFFSNR